MDKKASRVSVRGGFSDRNGIKPENAVIQLTSFDKRTRVQLQNMISRFYCQVYANDLNWNNPYIQDFIKYVLGMVYSEAVDARKTYDDNLVLQKINNTVASDEYDDVLTLIEALVQYWDLHLKEVDGFHYYDRINGKYPDKSIFEYANYFFEREYVGYRFVGGIIVPISDSFEVQSVSEALNNKYKVVHDHIAKANRYLADRDKPDYENSIKESISAVEALSEVLTETTGREATLGRMLNKLEDNGIVVHSKIKEAFKLLYAYASNANGIRHAGDIGGPSSTFEEAKFILVACSAFINYLTALNAD